MNRKRDMATHCQFDVLEAENPGFVYLIGSDQYHWYKIGLTRGEDFNKRALEVQRVWHCPECVLLEKYLHRILHRFRLRGEWFYLTVGDLDNIRNHVAEHRPNDAFLLETEPIAQKRRNYHRIGHPRRKPIRKVIGSWDIIL